MQEMTYCISNEDNTNNSLRKNYFQCVYVNGRNFFQKKNFCYCNKSAMWIVHTYASLPKFSLV